MDEKIYNLITIALNVIVIYHVVIGFLLGFIVMMVLDVMLG